MKLTAEQIKEIKTLREQGMKVAAIAEKFGVCKQIIYYHTNDKYRSFQLAYSLAYSRTAKSKAQRKAYRETVESQAHQKAYQKAYSQTDKYKAYQKAYYQTDKHQAYRNSYYQRVIKPKRLALKQIEEIRKAKLRATKEEIKILKEFELGALEQIRIGKLEEIEIKKLGEEIKAKELEKRRLALKQTYDKSG